MKSYIYIEGQLKVRWLNVMSIALFDYACIAYQLDRSLTPNDT